MKTQYNIDKSDLEKKILDTGGLVEKSDYNAKITEIESKIPSIIDLVTSAALNAVENKISNVSNLLKNRDYDANISDIES